MIQLVPKYILQRHRVGNTQGMMKAVTLFIDISGFTALTESLMANGRVGAEVLADTLQSIFTPLVETIYAHNGFIASFAGDALIALFPVSDECMADSILSHHLKESMRSTLRIQHQEGEFSTTQSVAGRECCWAGQRSSNKPCTHGGARGQKAHGQSKAGRN